MDVTQVTTTTRMEQHPHRWRITLSALNELRVQVDLFGASAKLPRVRRLPCAHDAHGCAGAEGMSASCLCIVYGTPVGPSSSHEPSHTKHTKRNPCEPASWAKRRADTACHHVRGTYIPTNPRKKEVFGSGRDGFSDTHDVQVDELHSGRALTGVAPQATEESERITTRIRSQPKS